MTKQQVGANTVTEGDTYMTNTCMGMVRRALAGVNNTLNRIALAFWLSAGISYAQSAQPSSAQIKLAGPSVALSMDAAPGTLGANQAIPDQVPSIQLQQPVNVLADLDGTNWLAALGVDGRTYDEVATNVQNVKLALLRCTHLTNDAEAADYIDRAVSAYENLSEGQIGEIMVRMNELITSYEAERDKMQQYQLRSGPANSSDYGEAAAAWRQEIEKLRARSEDLAGIRAEVKQNAGNLKQRRALIISLVRLRSAKQLDVAIDHFVQAVKKLDKEIETALATPLTAPNDHPSTSNHAVSAQK